jgi:hypothetical protein
MESTYCSRCNKKCPLSFFVPDTNNNNIFFSTCIDCRTQSNESYSKSRTKTLGQEEFQARRETCASGIVKTMKLRNEMFAYTQQNSEERSASIDDRVREGSNGTTRVQRPPTNPSFPPDTTDRISSCLEEEFPRYAAATDNFPPEINRENIRRCYNEYQQRIDWCADRSPCGICGGSFQSDSVTFYSQERLLELENEHELDCCAVREDGASICITCGRDLELKRRMSVPKFSGANWVNKSLCQHRPTVFDELTLVECQVIARCHLVGYVVRLPRDTKPEISYSGTRGHIIAFKQDPSELLSILPSPDLRLSSIITVSWDEPSQENLRKFCAIRKKKVARALYWLCRNNPLWRDHVTVNEDLLKSWPDELIPHDLLENVVRTEPGLSDNREGYAMDREEMVGGDNDDIFENDLDRLARDANPGTIVTGAFLHDPESSNDGWRERHAALFAELEAAMHNEATNEKDLPVPHIKYRSTFGGHIELVAKYLILAYGLPGTISSWRGWALTT